MKNIPPWIVSPIKSGNVKKISLTGYLLRKYGKRLLVRKEKYFLFHFLIKIPMQWLKHKILSFQTIIWPWKKWLKTHKIHSQCTSNGTILKGKLQKTLQNRARNILKLHLNFDNSVYRKKTFTFYYKHGSGLFWKLIVYWTKNLINLPNNKRISAPASKKRSNKK